MAMVNVNAAPEAGPPQWAEFAEGESWFTQGRPVVPAAIPVEALPKQSWDSYKPDFWWGIISLMQAPLRNLPVQWASPDGWAGTDGPWLYNPRSDFPGLPMSPVAGNAHQVFGMSAPSKGIYTGTPDPIGRVAPWLR